MLNLQNPGKLFTISIVVLITLVIGTQIVTFLSVNERSDETKTINVAGSQRMLSQKITKLAYQYKESINQDIAHKLVAEANSWNQIQQGLVQGSEALNLKADTFSDDDELFEQMQPVHNAIYNAAIKVGEEGNTDDLLNDIFENEAEYLRLMDAAVFAMEAEAERSNQKTGIYKLIFFVVIMIITGGVGFVFVRPLSKQIRKEFSEEGIQNKKHFQAVFEDSGIGIAFVSPEGRLFRINSFFCDLLGYSEDQMLSMTFPEFTHPDDLEKDWKLFTEMVEAKRNHYQIEKRYFHKNGEVVWVTLSVSRINDDEGELDYVVAMIQDITEEKALEEEREEKELLFESVFNSTYSFCGVAKPDGTLIELNKPALEFAQLTYEDLDGLKLQEGPWWPGQEQRDKAQIAINEARKGKIARFDLKVENPDGLLLVIDFSIVPVMNKEGEVILLIPEGREINEKIALIEETKQANERLEEAQRIGKVGNWQWDMIKDQITWSDINYEVFGMPKSFKPNFEDLNEMIHPDDREPFQKDVETAIAENKEHNFVHRIVLNEGKDVRYIHERGKVFYDEGGKPVRMSGTSQNVTETYEKEAELEAQRDELQNALSLLSETQQAARIGSWEVDLQENKPYWSDEVYRIHEVEIGTEIDLKNAIKFYRKDFQDVIQAAMNDSIENRSSWDVECVLVTAKDNEIWVRATGHPVFENKELIGLRGLFMDIDDEKRKTLELEATAEKLQMSVEAGNIAIWIWDLATNELDWNDQAYQVFGVNKETFEPTFEKFAEMVHPDDLEHVKSSTGKTIETGVSFDTEFRFIWPNGEVRNLSGRGEIVYDKDGNPEKMIGINQDITERTQLFERIKEQEQQLRSFVEQAPAAVAMFDTEMKYITASNQWYNHNDLEDRDIIGKSHYKVVPDVAKREDWKQIHQQVLNGEEFSNTKDKFIKETGEQIWLNWKAIPWYNSEAEIGGMIMYVSDISKEVQYTDQLEEEVSQRTNTIREQALELKETNKELESFSYTISHDLRAPLRSINGFSDILVEEYADQLDEEGKRLLGIVKQSAVTMGTLIDDILDFSRLGRKAVRKSEIDMNLLFESICEKEKNRYTEAKCELKIQNLPAAKGDISLIKQVVTNLVSNAFKYSSKNETIKIAIKAEEKDSSIVYSISDNGTGFKMEYHNKLFEVFHRLHTKNEFEGTGVGLATVKRIINKHGGEVWAESEPGNGSIFYFSLPKK